MNPNHDEPTIKIATGTSASASAAQRAAGSRIGDCALRIALSFVLVCGLWTGVDLGAARAFAQDGPHVESASDSPQQSGDEAAAQTMDANAAGEPSGPLPSSESADVDAALEDSSQLGDASASEGSTDKTAPESNALGFTDQSGAAASSEPFAPGSESLESSEAGANSSPVILADPKVQLSSSDWNSSGDNFSVSVQAGLPEGSTGNRLVVHLPQHIALAQTVEANPSQGILAVSISGAASDPAGTTIDVTVADSGTSSAVRGFDMYLSQQSFIENAREGTTGFTYDIAAKLYHSGSADPIETSRRFAPDTWAQSLYLTTGTNVGDTMAVDFGVSDTWKPIVYLDTEVDITDEVSNLFGEVHVPEASLRVFDVEPGATIDSSGDLVVPYDATDVDPGNSKRFKIEMPLTVSLEKMAQRYSSLLTRSMTLGFDPYVSLASGQMVQRSGEAIKMVMPAIMQGLLNQNQNAVNKDRFYSSIDSMRIGDDGAGDFSFHWGIWKPTTPEQNYSSAFPFSSGELNDFSDIEMSFVLPSDVEWKGTSSYYDAGTRRVTLPLVLGDAVGISGSVALKIADGSKPRYKPLSPGTDGASFQISGFNLSYTYKGVRVTMPDLYVPDRGNYSITPATLPIAGTPLTSQDEGYYNSKSGKSDSVLYKLGYYQRASYDRDIYPFAYEADVDPNFFPVGKVRVNQEGFARLLAEDRTAKLEYTTSTHSETRTSTLTSDLVLPDGEYLTSWKLSFPNGLARSAVGGSSSAVGEILSFEGRAPDITENSVVKTTSITQIDLRTDEEAKWVTPLSLNSRILRTNEVTDVIDRITPNGSMRYADYSLIDVVPRGGTAEERASLVDGSYTIEWDLPEHLHIIGLTSHSINGKMTYTTNLRTTPQQSNSVGLGLLRDGEYLTSLTTTIKMPTTSETSSKLQFYTVIDPDYVMTQNTEYDSLTARVLAGENIPAHEKTNEWIRLQRQANVQLGMRNAADVEWAASGSVQAGSDFDVAYKPYVGLFDKGLTDAEARAIKVENPTLYFEVPRYISYVEGSFAINGASKQPTVTRIAGPDSDTSYIKMEFSGDANSPTGIALSTTPHTAWEADALSFKMHVESFAPAGLQNQSRRAYVDLEPSMEILRGRDMLVAGQTGSWKDASGIYNAEGYSTRTSLLDGATYKNVYEAWSRSAPNFTILQYRNTVFSTKVNTAQDATLRSDATVISGQTLNAFLDISNNADNMSDLVVYVPVAREGRDDGNGASQWSIQLASAVLNGSATNVNVEFSTHASPTMAGLTEGGVDPVGMYSSQDSVADLSQVTMVKLTVPSLPTGANLAMMAGFKSLGDKTASGNLTNRIAARYGYRGGAGWTSGSTALVNLTLADTVVSGKVWDDLDADGSMDASEAGLSNVRLTLRAQDDALIAETRSAADGSYSFSRPSLHVGAYLEVEKPTHKALTHQAAYGVAAEMASAFDQASYRAYLTAGDTAHVNAGFVDSQDLSFTPDEYTIRVGKTEQLVHSLDPADPDRDLQYTSSDYGVAAVDGYGLVTGESEGTAQITGSFVNDAGTTVGAQAMITVESNDAPVVSGPTAAVELNEGDAWDPRDTSLVPGLAVTDDHDALTVDDLQVTGDSSFATDGKAASPGTYEITYNVSDSDGNAATAFTVKVKVHGLPYLADTAGDAFGADGPPIRYVRLDEAMDPFEDVRAFWLKASDTVGVDPAKTEILPADASTGTFTLENTKHENGRPAPVIGSVGAYNGDYHLVTPQGGTTDVNRVVHARGQLSIAAQSISVPSTASKTQFDTFDEFEREYHDKLNVWAGLYVMDETTHAVDYLNLFDEVDVVGDMSSFDFSLPEGETTGKTIPLTLTVTDTVPAGTYGDKTMTFDIVVTVLRQVGDAPTITFPPLQNPLQRVASDTVQLKPEEGSPTMTDAQLYGKLLGDAEISDTDGTVEGSITGGRVVHGGDGVNIDTIDPLTSGPALRKMLTTPGTYELTYRAEDDDHNVVTAVRRFEVASATKFVLNYGTPDEVDAPAIVNLRQVEGDSWSPSGKVTAYHIGSDGTTEHMTPLTSIQSVDRSTVKASTVTAQSKHHYWFWPATTLDRPLDQLRQTVLVHGPIEFRSGWGDIEAFVDESVDVVTGVTAEFERALPGSSTGAASTVMQPLTVTTDTADTVTRTTPEAVTVTYTAEDDVSGSDIGNVETAERTVYFYGKPELTAPASVGVRTGATTDEIKSAIAATASVALPDGGSHDLTDDIVYDLVDVGESGGTAHLSVDFSVEMHSKTEFATADVTVEVSAPPVITANDISLNVGDTLDVAAQGNVVISDDHDALTANDLVVSDVVPVDGDGKVTEPATYAVELSVTDTAGNRTARTINVRVNGLPVITGVTEMVARVGDSLSVWDRISVSWMKAPVSPGPATEETFRYGDDSAKGDIVLGNYRRVEPSGETSVDASALNVAGLYKGDFVATTPEGGVATATQTLKLHGRPTITMNDITLAATQEPLDGPALMSQYESALGIVAQTKHVADDGTVTDVDLLDDGAVTLDVSRIDFEVIGIYDLTATARDVAPGVAEKSVSVTSKVGINTYNGTPPTVTSHTVQRVSTDPVLNAAGETLQEYLVGPRFIEVTKQTHDPNASTIEKIEKVSGPSLSDPNALIAAGAAENLDGNNDGAFDETELNTMFTTVGSYRITYKVTDAGSNHVPGTATLDVAGPTEFGYVQGAQFTPVRDIVQARQKAGGTWSSDGIVARHLDMDGTYHQVPLDPIDTTTGMYDLDDVGILDFALSAAHHRSTYEDGTARLHDRKALKVLVQGRVAIAGADDPSVVYQGDALNVLDGLSASYQRINERGVVSEQTVPLTVISAPRTSTVGMFAAEVSATDTLSGAPDASDTKQRVVSVNGIPQLQYNSSISVPTNASESQIRNALRASAAYTHAASGMPRDISASIDMDIAGLDVSRAGETLTLDLSVPYTLDPVGSERKATGRASIYIDAPPSYASANDDFTVGDGFDPLEGLAFSDKEDGVLAAATNVAVKSSTVDVSAAGTYQVVYTVTDLGGNTVDLDRMVKVHGKPTIAGVPAQLSTRVGTLPANPLAGVAASYLKAGDNVGDAPVSTDIPAVTPSSTVSTLSLISPLAGTGGLSFGNLANNAGLPVIELASPGLYTGTYTAENPYGGKTTDSSKILVHGVPEIESTGLDVLKNDTAPVDIARLVAEAGLTANVQHAAPDGSVTADPLPASAMSIVSSNVDVAKEGTYQVRVSVFDATLPAASREADVEVRVGSNDAPVITASDIALNVGDELDVLAQSGAAVSDDHDALTAADLAIAGNVPVDADGKVTTPGTTAVEFAAVDSQGNRATKTIMVRVNGLPSIVGAPSQLWTRVGMLPSLDELKATYLKAPEGAGAAVETTIDLVLMPVENGQAKASAAPPASMAAPTAPGLVKARLVGTTPSGATAEVPVDLLVHGMPQVTSTGLEIAKGDATAITVERLVKDAGLEATVEHVAADGSVRSVKLPASALSIVSTTVDAAVPGTYAVKVAAHDATAPAATQEVDVQVKVAGDSGNGGGNGNGTGTGNGNGSGGAGSNGADGSNGDANALSSGQDASQHSYLTATGDSLPIAGVVGIAVVGLVLAFVSAIRRYRKE